MEGPEDEIKRQILSIGQALQVDWISDFHTNLLLLSKISLDDALRI
jgi:hypothetical protein